MQKLFKVDEISDLYADSYLTDDEGNLIFISLWGRDITMNEFFARITLNDAEISIRSFHLINPETNKEVYVHIRNRETLEKHTGRVTTSVFGEMVQGFLYEKMAIKPDFQSGKALVMYQGEKQPDIWELVKQVCHIPLVDHWQALLIDKFTENNWIRQIPGVGVNAIQINFDHITLEELVSNEVKKGQLTAIDGVPAPEPVIVEFPNSDNEQYHPATKVEAIQAMKILKDFICEPQLKAMADGFRCEEKQFFFDKAVEMANIISKMPKTYEQGEKGSEALAILHYFHGNMDWYISEKDICEEQHQAYGLADMGYPEFGYISIVELVKNNVELDLHFEPQTLKALKKQLNTKYQPAFETT